MKLHIPIPVKELANRFNMKLIGNENQLIYGLNEIHKVEEGDLTFVDAEKYTANFFDNGFSYPGLD